MKKTSAKRKKPSVLDQYGGLLICASLLGFAFYVNRARAAAAAGVR